MKLLCCLALCCCLYPLFGQEPGDNIASSIPERYTWSAADIAAYINSSNRDPMVKLRAVYSWVTQHIEYSKDSLYYYRNWSLSGEDKMKAILRRRKGVCENYAELFTGIVQRCGIPAYTVSGHTKTGGTVHFTGHGWVAVKPAGQWLLCDPTWDAGYNSYQHYLVEPEVFIQSHMPFDPVWQLLEHPWSHEDFNKGYSHRSAASVNYNDSIRQYLSMDSLQQLQVLARRMKAAGLINEDLRLWHSYQLMKINSILQEENHQLYESSVALLNQAKKIYNTLVQLRNNRFDNAPSFDELKRKYSEVDRLLQEASKLMDSVGQKAENYQYDTDALGANIQSLRTRNEAQLRFAEKYFAADLPTRQQLLLQ